MRQHEGYGFQLAIKSAAKTFLAWTGSPLFSYVTLLLLQLKIVWGAWSYRDLTYGDTSSYFVTASTWYRQLQNNIAWSPLYTAFYGTLLGLSRDAAAVTLLHRLIIVFTLAVLVLAVMRRFFPGPIAWLVAAWWVILPINFDALYEVHLFAIILPLAAVMLIFYRFNAWTRAICVATFVATAVLVRNEMSIAAILLAAVWIIWEIRNRRAGKLTALRTVIVPYAAALFVVGLLILFFYSRSVKQFPALSEALKAKEQLNVCEAFAFGYQQRHPEWTKNPFLDCHDVITQEFGIFAPSWLQAAVANPRAMAEHLLWNASLVPSGLQLAVFNAASGTVNPDFASSSLGSGQAGTISIVVLIVVAIGLIFLYLERVYWWNSYLKPRIWGTFVFGAGALVMATSTLLQRPRPSYMFMLTLFLMAFIGLCGYAIVRRLQAVKLLTAAVPVLAMLLILVMPSYYTAATSHALTDLYYRLQPFRNYIGLAKTSFMLGDYGTEICNYYARGLGTCEAVSYDVVRQRPADMPLGNYLMAQNPPVNLLYTDNRFLGTFQSDPAISALLSHPADQGWVLLAEQDIPGPEWRLYANKSLVDLAGR